MIINNAMCGRKDAQVLYDIYFECNIILMRIMLTTYLFVKYQSNLFKLQQDLQQEIIG